MNQFFGTHYSQEDLQQRLAQRRGRNDASRSQSMSMRPPLTSQHNDGTMDTGAMMGGDSLDDIIMQNSKELQRRQSYPRPYGADMTGGDSRRGSMMEFGSNDNALSGYQFSSSATTGGDAHMRRQSSGEIDMGGYSDMNPEMMPSHLRFTSSMQATEPLTIESDPYQSMSPDIVQGMMGYGPMGMGMEGMSDGEPTPMLFAQSNFSFANGSMDPMSSEFMMPPEQAGLQSHLGALPKDDEGEVEMIPSVPGLNVADASIVSSPQNMNIGQRSTYGSPTPVNAKMPSVSFSTQDSYSVPGTTALAPLPEPVPAVQTPKEPPVSNPKFKDVYSASGFDMLKALMKVASRKDPEINIGAVDMSCAFVVCDLKQADCPIIYVSDIFERLTGYNKHEVLGRNCRFLQSPHGKVQGGVKRTYVDDDTVYYLKDKIGRAQEAQRSLINYRKGGQPFMNLLTMIPIPWDTDEIRYYVGFQVDLVEQPGSVAGKGAGGSYTVNYSRGLLPSYVWQPPEGTRPQSDAGQTISRDDVSAVLTSFNNGGESELTKRMWDKVLLENTDDVVHVLSLKGLFLYLSPSSRKVLEYDSSELVGTALSSICHPSDIVPVTRELKDTSTGAAVSVVFRIRRKNSGYTWFESHGALCVEQGKGRKCVILVGRERPVYAISRLDIGAVGGIGENELWTKLSTSGMFLFVSSNVRTLIDRPPEELVGTSIQSIMRPESKIEFGRSLEKARTGKRISFKHEVLNKRGLVLQAQTNLYPGDAAEGSKPTFLVAQTRFLKSTSRSGPGPALSSGSGTSYGREFGEVHSPLSTTGPTTEAGGAGLPIGSQDLALASDNNIFDELKTTRCTSWQFELRQMEKSNRLLAEELASLLANKKKRKRRKGAGHLQRDCANCHTRTTPEWRRGPSGQRDLCNSCGLRYAKQTGRVSPRTSNRGGDSASKPSATSPPHKSSLRKEIAQPGLSSSNTPNVNSSTQQASTNPNPAPESTGSVGSGSSTITATTHLASLGGRTIIEGPVHSASQGFNEGGDRGITNIMENDGGGS